MTEHFTYQGNELELFQHAKNWKAYFSRIIKPFIKGAVLEVGAGIGSTTLLLNDGSSPSWLMLEPDASMSQQLSAGLAGGAFPANCSVQTGTIDTLTATFDTIIYIDVLEHIEKDGSELIKAAALLKSGGHIIVLSPAFQHLYSPFDKAIGHCRRYNRQSLAQLTPQGLAIVGNRYYDTVGYFASVMNKIFLRQKYPTAKQVLFWDRWMIPVSRITDKVFMHGFGKSIICIWQKKAE